ncbi:MAG: MltA domain-containing protein [Litorimonas sp.]
MMSLFKYTAIIGLACLSACTTVPRIDQTGANFPNPDVENPGIIVIAEPVLTPKPAEPIPAPPPPAPEPPEQPVYELPNEFANLEGWLWSDIEASFASFRNSCKSWAQADQSAMLNPNLPQYGRYSDWAQPCQAAIIATQPHRFFEAHFAPVQQSTDTERDGLLTGYYEPEMEVRLKPDAEFYEPILAKPANKDIQSLSRANLSARSSRVIAYGRPIDVFFLQIQGSGRIRYKNGTSLRAAYAGNNGKSYKSIGKVLVERGELTVQQASKQAIEDWMTRNGRKAARDLMNENPRYIFFTEQKIEGNEGPRGAMRVPLTAMGSLAVDPRYHPYGVPIWLETTLPQKGGDFRGTRQNILVMAQDTGSAIRGPLRGDLFFGSGEQAGARAGVMKHRAVWFVFLPKALALKNTPSPTS